MRAQAWAPSETQQQPHVPVRCMRSPQQARWVAVEREHLMDCTHGQASLHDRDSFKRVSYSLLRRHQPT